MQIKVNEGLVSKEIIAVLHCWESETLKVDQGKISQ